jgi:para-aminobenzoate synthetase component 2
MTRAPSRPKILVLNNRDSFVFNLARYLEELDADAQVVDSHAIGVEQIGALAPDGLLISPGPCTPAEAGVSVDVIKAFSGRLPILGVCLGHQAIAAASGWTIEPARAPRHGRAIKIAHEGRGLFAGLPSPLEVGLYHSLVGQPSAPGGGTPPLRVDAVSSEGDVMALSRLDAPVFGVQFHPESILTEHGHALLENFLAFTRPDQRGAKP